MRLLYLVANFLDTRIVSLKPGNVFSGIRPSKTVREETTLSSIECPWLDAVEIKSIRVVANDGRGR
jgi:hypothetical protein